MKDFCYHYIGGRLEDRGRLWRLTTNLLHKFAIITAGDARWRNCGFTGLKATPAEKQFFRAFHERNIECYYFVPETLTTAVRLMAQGRAFYSITYLNLILLITFKRSFSCARSARL